MYPIQIKDVKILLMLNKYDPILISGLITICCSIILLIMVYYVRKIRTIIMYDLH